MIPGCDSNGPALCVDISDKNGLLCLQNIADGTSPNVFPQFTVKQLETSGILQGNLFITESIIIIKVITVKVSRVFLIQICWHFPF